MSKRWLEIAIKLPANGVDLACYCFNESGCSGVIVEERELDTFVLPGFELENGRDYRIRAFFPEPDDRLAWRADIESRLKEIGSWIRGWPSPEIEVISLAEEAWAEDWKQHFHSFRIGDRLVFKPTWEDYSAARDDILINLDPGMAFGTGTHATTRLCLESLNTLLGDNEAVKSVLDVGTGSAILALGAAALGVERVLGCDIDETACQVARQNIALNGMQNIIEVTDRPVCEIEETFDIVLANILAEENVRLASDLCRCLKRAGRLVLSGILSEKEALVLEGFSDYPLGLPQVTRLQDWSCFTFQKKT